MIRHTSSLVTLGLLTSALASGQQPSIFVDIGSAGFGAGVPTDGYAAAAPSGGQWNGVDSDLFDAAISYTTPTLFDTQGSATGVTLQLDALTSNYNSFEFDEPFTTGDDQALLDDLTFASGPSRVTVNGLAPGSYDVYTYVLAPDDSTGRTTIDVLGSVDPLQTVGGDFSAGFVQGVTHALHNVTVAAGQPLEIELDFTVFSDSLSGLQIVPGDGGGLGTNYCPANVNSSGTAAEISASGSTLVASNDVTLLTTNVPTQSFGFFLVSSASGFVPNPGGSNGNLCISGLIGRFVGPGQIQSSGTAGELSIVLDLTALPQPNGTAAVQPGDIFFFQSWFRDTNAMPSSSNLSDGLEINFL